MRNNKAFTLAEVMITMAILGILASVLLPAVSKVRPNENKALFKKAYYVAERMVSELVNDESLYPMGEGTSVGLDNVSEVTYDGKTYKGNDKFCKLFAAKVNTINDNISCVAGSSVPTDSNVPSFITTDGIAWYMPYTDFSPVISHVPDCDLNKGIIVDVNGDKKPNCSYTANTCINPDRFEICIEPSGKMYVTGVKEREYLSSNKSMQ